MRTVTRGAQNPYTGRAATVRHRCRVCRPSRQRPVVSPVRLVLRLSGMRRSCPSAVDAYAAAAMSVLCFACVPVVIKLTGQQSDPFWFNTVAMAVQALVLAVLLAPTASVVPAGGWVGLLSVRNGNADGVAGRVPDGVRALCVVCDVWSTRRSLLRCSGCGRW